MRVMHQLGLLDRLLTIGQELSHQKLFTVNGYKFKDTTATSGLFKKNHGIAPTVFSRPELVQTIYDGLPHDAKAKVLTGKKVVDIIHDKDGIMVSCSDGTGYQGSMVLGADGLQSRMRRLMRKMALEADPKAKWDPEQPYTASYRALWCRFPRPSDAGEAFETQKKGSALVYFTGREHAWILLFEKLPRPTKEPVIYTDEDVAAFADRYSHFPINETLKVKDAFATRLVAGMANLEEGVLKHWSWGRVVLAGDACHKFTPNSGLGFNNGIQDIVVLCNLLRNSLAAAPTDPLALKHSPNGPGLSNATTGLKSARIDGARIVFISGLTAEASWPQGQRKLQETTPIEVEELAGTSINQPFSRCIIIQLPEDVVSFQDQFQQLTLDTRGGVICVFLTPARGRSMLPNSLDHEFVIRSLLISGKTQQDVETHTHYLRDRLRSGKFILWVGYSVRSAAALVRQVAEHFDLPVMCTPRAKGISPENHPPFRGSTGFLSRVDDRIGYTSLRVSWCLATEMIRVDLDPLEVRRNVASHATIIEAEIAELLQSLIAGTMATETRYQQLPPTIPWENELQTNRVHPITVMAIVQDIAIN
ncbi:FAD-dependent monooxygenase sdnN [Cladobotryum mycophilum]|uniref:FAD-dependent monooxygenase sdnN n=1 Tax=Cladobotryum mycophilum TaxID=491253 RepID=A0ABR0S989_9HYPO